MHKNAEKKRALLKARADNAKGASPPVACQALKAPSAEAVKAYDERRAAGGRGAGRGRGRGRGRGAGGAAVDEEDAPADGKGAAKGTAATEKLGGGAAIDFYAGLEDISDAAWCAYELGVFDDAECASV